MKINQITLKNMKGAPNFTMVPSTLNFLTGPSGSGKTSTMEAIRYAFTGKMPKEGMRMGAASSSVSITLEEIGVITRIQDVGKPSKVRFNEHNTTAKSVAALMEEHFGCSIGTTDLMTSAELAQKKELVNYLFDGGFLENTVTFPRLVALCDGLSKDAINALGRMLPNDSSTPITLENIADAYTGAMALRQSNKKLLAQAEAKAVYDGIVPAQSADTLQRQLEDVRVHIRAAETRKGEISTAKATIKKREDSLAALKVELAKYDAVKAVGAREKAVANDNVENAIARQNALNASIADAQKTIKSMTDILAALSSSVCPISGKLVCTTDKTVVRDELEQAKRDAQTSLNMLMGQQAEAAAALERARNIVKSLNEQEKQYERKIALRRQYDDLESMPMPTLVEAPDESEIARMHMEADRLANLLSIATAYERAVAAQKEADVLREAVNTSEELVANLAPNGGIRKKVLIHSIGVLEDACNAKMKDILPYYTMRFDPENDFDIELTSADGSIHYDNLSNGEKARMMFIILCTLSELNGFRILMLDDINSMDREVFEAMLDLIEKHQTDFDHIFIAGLDNPGFVDAVEASPVPHKVFHLA